MELIFNIVIIFSIIITFVHSTFYTSFGAKGQITCYGRPFKNGVVRFYDYYTSGGKDLGDLKLDYRAYFIDKYTFKTSTNYTPVPYLYIQHNCGTYFRAWQWTYFRISKKYIYYKQTIDKYEDFKEIKLEHNNNRN